MDGAFVVCVFFDREDYGCETDCFAGEPGDALEGEEVVCVIGEGFVLLRWVSCSVYGRGSFVYIPLRTSLRGS